MDCVRGAGALVTTSFGTFRGTDAFETVESIHISWRSGEARAGQCFYLWLPAYFGAARIPARIRSEPQRHQVIPGDAQDGAQTLLVTAVRAARDSGEVHRVIAVPAPILTNARVNG